MKRFIRSLKVKSIDVFIFRMDTYVDVKFSTNDYFIHKINVPKKTGYFIKDSDTLVHESYVYKKVFLLKSIQKEGPVIGNCFTNRQYRGQSIYPYVINQIAKELLSNGCPEVFVVVNRNNESSIKGIEKAGFKKFASITSKRWLWFYWKKNIQTFN